MKRVVYQLVGVCWATVALADPPDAGPPPVAPASVDTTGISPEDLEVIRQMELLRELGLLQRMHLFVEVDPPKSPPE